MAEKHAPDLMRDALNRSELPIVVGGCHRSGTSLLRRVLNAHSNIYCGPEVKFFRDFYGDYFDDRIRHLRFAESARALLPEAELFDILGKAYLRILDSAAQRAGKRRWADKNPENVLYLDAWNRLLGAGWVLVHVVRNPLDTLASIAERPFPLSIPASLDDRISFYRKYTEAGLRFGAAYPARYFRVHYERLVDTPDLVLSDLMSWLGEALEPGQFEFNTFPHQPGLEDPKVSTTSAIHAQSVGRWRNSLTGEEARTIWKAAGELWAEVGPAEDLARLGAPP